MPLTAAQKKTSQRIRRHRRARARLFGTNKIPRLSVFKSNTHIYAQLIDDSKNATLVGLSTKSVKGKTMGERALAVGKAVAKSAAEQKIKRAVFDRGGYMYTGNVKAVAEGARDGGLTI